MAVLSPDLVYNVLLRLPVKSLLRLRYLSKYSCSEIDSADFVKNHLKRSVQSKASQKLIVNSAADSQFYFAGFDDDLQHTFPLNNPMRFYCFFTWVCGSCNGLILLGIGIYQNTMNLTIWNPFTRRYKIILLSPALTRNLVAYGLGYDSAHDDYEIVLISTFNNVSSLVWVFSLKSNSWRCSQVLADEPSSSEGYYANGALYWAIRDPFKSKFFGFDLTNEVFFDLPRLPDCGPETVCFYDIMVLGCDVYTQTMHVTSENLEFYMLVSDKGREVASGNWRKEFTVKGEEIIMKHIFPPFPLA
ncbi:hypothetical protein SLA2020_292100 [Shorea laevis]